MELSGSKTKNFFFQKIKLSISKIRKIFIFPELELLASYFSYISENVTF